MLKRLIEITNSDRFIQNGHIAIKEVIARQNEFDLKIIFEIQDSLLETTQCHCEIYCEGIAYTTSNRLHEYKRPYNRINLYNDHPVLWNYESSQYLTLMGPCANIAELMGDLFIAHDGACGNWVDFHWLFFDIYKRISTKERMTVELPKRLINTYIPVFNKHKLSYSFDETRDVNHNYSVLLFGNPDISPDDYNFGQPYIVGERFTETLECG